ncbi:MAG TPA: molybdopterin-dependent oxidoreductase [Burkholderiales bacterium]|nr:molybdopterin-dependent oxidoreductase [Burkholderiales bacterium]
MAIGGAALAGRAALSAAEGVMLPIANGQRGFAAYPQKRPLIVMTQRPVQLETPMPIFNEGVFTPNDAFFVRWHISGVPTSVDATKHRINVHGLVKQPLSLSVADLRNHYEQIEFAAVCQCSGNSRGLFEPRVAGGEWTNGAMGNAMWKGVRLRDILAKAGVQTGALQVRFNGLDTGPMTTVPDLIKALDVDQALREDVIVAYEMNGQPLPVLNGFPVRLVVPGWYATYWVKMLHDVEVIGSVDNNFWMNPAYRIPDNACACIEPGQKTKTIPINRMDVRSFITSVQDGARVPVRQRVTVQGIAFDGGYGIKKVLFSPDGGRSWSETRLGRDHGNYSFRQWETAFEPPRPGTYDLQVLAFNTIGESQRFTPRWNPAGYMRNVVETVRVHAA